MKNDLEWIQLGDNCSKFFLNATLNTSRLLPQRWNLRQHRTAKVKPNTGKKGAWATLVADESPHGLTWAGSLLDTYTNELLWHPLIKKRLSNRHWRILHPPLQQFRTSNRYAQHRSNKIDLILTQNVMTLLSSVCRVRYTSFYTWESYLQIHLHGETKDRPLTSNEQEECLRVGYSVS